MEFGIPSSGSKEKKKKYDLNDSNEILPKKKITRK